MIQNDDFFPTGDLELPGEQQKPVRSSRKRPRIGGKKLLLTFVGLVLLLALGYGAWKLLASKKQSQPAAQQTIQTPPESSPAATTQDEIPDAGEIKTLKSSTPRLELSYPASWTLTQAESGIKIESPPFTYQSVEAGNISGNFRIYIRQGARPVDSKYIGRGVAIKPSEKLTYTAPVTGQRPDTNLTAFGLDTPDHFAYFFIAGNYTLKINDTLGPTYGKEPETYIVTGGYSSKDLTEDLATHQVSQDYYASTNAYKQALEIIKSLKLL